MELNQPRRVSERKQACEVWREISQLCGAEEPEPTYLIHVEPVEQPQTFPNDLYHCLCWGKTHHCWLWQAGMEVTACTPSLLHEVCCRRLLQSQALPPSSSLSPSAAQASRATPGASPSHTGSDQEFLVHARKKGFCLNDVLGLYFPGLTHSLEGKRGV